VNILIVDDIAANRKLVRVTLEAEGHSTLEAADGIEAIQILSREKVDAVISDVLMPNMDGFRLCYEIRKSQKHQNLPFIISSATYNSPNDMELAKSIGADIYLLKPTPARTLLEALREVTERKTSRPALASLSAEDSYVLKQYSQALVNKLEEKNAELQQAVAALRRAHEHIVKLNSDLEQRVKERTAELASANSDLARALSEVKVLGGLLPICGYCKKIRNDKNYWESVEVYLSIHTDAEFSHGVCPGCYENVVLPELEQIRPGNLPKGT
jgi:CheY-like chemotaxis protein